MDASYAVVGVVLLVVGGVVGLSTADIGLLVECAVLACGGYALGHVWLRRRAGG